MGCSRLMTEEKIDDSWYCTDYYKATNIIKHTHIVTCTFNVLRYTQPLILILLCKQLTDVKGVWWNMMRMYTIDSSHVHARSCVANMRCASNTFSQTPHLLPFNCSRGFDIVIPCLSLFVQSVRISLLTRCLHMRPMGITPGQAR